MHREIVRNEGDKIEKCFGTNLKGLAYTCDGAGTLSSEKGMLLKVVE